jgi:hypothetical protein
MADINDVELQLALGLGNFSDGSEIIEVKGNWYMDDISLFYYKDKIIIFGEDNLNIESRYDEDFIKIVYAALILETNRVFIDVKKELEYIKHKLFKIKDIIYYYTNDQNILYKVEGNENIMRIKFFGFINTMFYNFFNKGYGTDKENYFIEDDKLLNEFKNFN